MSIPVLTTDDALTRCARAIQNGEALPDGAVTAAADAAAPTSKYSEALHRGVSYLRTANRYFQREISLDEAKTAWSIGTPDL